MSYTYATPNKLEYPQDYCYSEWLGDDFFDYYLDQRNYMLIHVLPDPHLLQYSDNFCPTSKILWPVVVSIRDQLYTDDFDPMVLSFLKKFECFKRLYDNYTNIPPFKKLSSNFHDPDPYLLLAEIVLYKWTSTRKTFWFSCALKLSDTLCSISDILTITQKHALACLLKTELQLFHELFEATNENA